jgi:hypothetical protein
MDRDSANATRLRVNRIGLIQQINTQELIPKLIRAHIISADHDVEYINQGTSKIDRARRLIDCLLEEGSGQVNRPVNWFVLFRNILLENPSVYSNLVNTLDNTIIRKPDFAQRITQVSTERTTINQDSIDTNQVQQKISNIEFDRYAMNRVVIEGSFQKVIENLTYYSQVCFRLLFSFHLTH